MNNNYSSVFLGAFFCDNCGLICAFNVTPEIKRVPLVYMFTGAQINYTVKYVTCSYCGRKHKLKGIWKGYYKAALENHFDDNYIVNRLIRKVKDIAVRHNVIVDGCFNCENFNNAVDEIYRTYAIEYSYDREFYSGLCKLFAVDAAAEINKQNILYKSI